MSRARRWGRMGVVLVMSFGYLFLANISQDKYLLMKFLDIGQGDAILLVDSMTGARALVDGGPYSQVIYELDDSLPFWQRSLSVVVATHPDEDHISGLVEVFKRYEVGLYLWNGVERQTPAYEALNRQVGLSQAELQQPKKGQMLNVSEDLRLSWWWPGEQMNGLSVNDGSQVFLVEYGYFKALMTGDVESSILQRLSEEYGQQVDLLKVPHHGARNGLNEVILQVLQPRWSVVSAGEGNRYGHPSPEIMRLLAQQGAQVLRTDKDGAASVVIRGDGVSVYR